MKLRKQPSQTKKQSFWDPSVISTLVCFTMAACLGIGSLILPDAAISQKERRTLRSMPALSWKTVSSGRFMELAEPYLEDQVLFRDAFLDLNSLVSRYMYGNLDDNGIIEQDGSLIAMESLINESSLEYAASLFDSIYSSYLAGSDCSIYFSIIPDKGYYADQSGYLFMDYQAFFEKAASLFDWAQEADITETLSLSDYYASDSHWNQIRLLNTANALAKTLGVTIEQEYEIETALESFEGVYGSQSAWGHNTDALQYLYSQGMEDWIVTDYSTNPPVTGTVYNLENTQNLDPYDLFLEGSRGLITIENPNSLSDRELIVFRDSFGSSLAPLLASGYAKTTLVDLRYLPSWNLKTYVDFTDQDVLFLYSVSVLNNATTLK